MLANSFVSDMLKHVELTAINQRYKQFLCPTASGYVKKHLNTKGFGLGLNTRAYVIALSQELDRLNRAFVLEQIKAGGYDYELDKEGVRSVRLQAGYANAFATNEDMSYFPLNVLYWFNHPHDDKAKFAFRPAHRKLLLEYWRENINYNLFEDV